MIRRHPLSTTTNTLCPYTTVVRSSSGSIGRAEQAGMLVEGEAIGHAGDIVGHDTRGQRRFGIVRQLMPLGRQAIGLADIELEKILHDATSLVGHPIEDRKSTRLNSSH